VSKRLATALLAAWVLLFLDMTLRWFPGDHPPANLTPFRTIQRDWHEGGFHFWINLVGNVGYFVPGGFLYLRRRGSGTRLADVALAAAGLSVAIELAQFLSGRRVADVDDVLLNVAGALVGYWVGRALERRPAAAVPGASGA
jgi:glycopeptide antibiotics resistance protein